MSFTCEKCGNVSDQPANFCRKCGAPAATVTLATLPLSSAGAQATQEIAQLGTDALKTNPPTRPIAKVEESDPLDTWEPTKAVVSPAATEVLPSVTVPVSSAAGAEMKAVEPSVTSSASKKSNTGIFIATAAALLVLAVGGWLWLKRASVPPAVEIAPLASSSPAEAGNLTTPLPSPVTEAAPASVTESVANQSLANIKPSPSVKPGGKANVNATPSPQSNAYETASPATPAPAKAEPAAAENPASLVEQGNRLAGAGQLAQAIQVYEKARSANPGNADIYYLLGSAYHRSGDLANALDAYRKCTSGNYAAVAANHVKNLEKKLNKAK